MRFLERLSRKSFRVLVKPEPPIPMVGITTSDIDPLTGKVFPDYLARRAARASAKGAPQEFGTLERSVYPDE